MDIKHEFRILRKNLEEAVNNYDTVMQQQTSELERIQG